MLEQYSELLWFAAGIFSYRILSALFTYGHLAVYVAAFNKQALTALGTVAADLSTARDIKYKYLHRTGVSKDTLAETQELDEKTFNNWKASAIANLLMHFPKNYRFLLKYEDWESAMRELNRLYKRDIKSIRSNNNG
tara:strand:- start:3621 stop:4031 length:411 start_codon:yes stop_codon:yes gene_type:complete